MNDDISQADTMIECLLLSVDLQNLKLPRELGLQTKVQLKPAQVFVARSYKKLVVTTKITEHDGQRSAQSKYLKKQGMELDATW